MIQKHRPTLSHIRLSLSYLSIWLYFYTPLIFFSLLVPFRNRVYICIFLLAYGRNKIHFSCINCFSYFSRLLVGYVYPIPPQVGSSKKEYEFHRKYPSMPTKSAIKRRSELQFSRMNEKCLQYERILLFLLRLRWIMKKYVFL